MRSLATDIRKHGQESSFINDLVEKSRFSPLWRQVFAATGPIIASVSAGMTNGYSAILLPQLQRNDSSIQITPDQSSWIASMATLPMALGCILAGWLMVKLGRKITLLILSVTFAIGWSILSIAPTYNIILVGRFITGFSSGMAGPPSTVYIAETSDPKYRGFLLASITLAVSTGIFLTHFSGTFLHWNHVALICATFMILSYVTITISPETPTWLISRQAFRDSEVAFKWLRGYNDETLKEYDSMIMHSQVSNMQAYANMTYFQVFKDKVCTLQFLKPFYIILVFFFTMQFSGVNIVAFYTVSIMKDTLGKDINEYLAMLIIDVVRVVTSVVACILLRSIGRRPLAMISGFGTTASLIGLSAFLYAQENMEMYQNYSWVSLVFLVSYIVFVGIGLFPLPWCMIGELFPLKSRGIGTGLTSSWNFICFFIVIKTGPSLFEFVGVNGTFLIYGTICLFGTLNIYYILPETKNKTLEQIEDRFRASRKEQEAHSSSNHSA